MKQQKVVRTYPRGYTKSTDHLSEALKQGWYVVMANPFYCERDKHGTEYILEKDNES